MILKGMLYDFFYFLPFFGNVHPSIEYDRTKQFQFIFYSEEEINTSAFLDKHARKILLWKSGALKKKQQSLSSHFSSVIIFERKRKNERLM
jgi:hypothetical protein